MIVPKGVQNRKLSDFVAVFEDVCRMFYLQRCGCAVNAGIFSHPPCHMLPARIYGTTEFGDVTGGWHDAGDYGRYVVPAAKAVADLLLAYAASPLAFSDSLGIPESGNGVPDILDEVRYELTWMQKMQRDDGGVYHKVTCGAFPGFVMPHQETEELILSPVSTAATGDFAAAMAMAYPVFRAIDPAFARDCLHAAERAWEYLRVTDCNPFINPEGIVTGEYGDTNDADERYWAACALYGATGDEVYHDYIKISFNPAWAADLGWADVGAYGNAIYLGISDNRTDGFLKGAIMDALLRVADRLVAVAHGNKYAVTTKEYIWGSNMTVLNNAMLLLMAYDAYQKDTYLDCAKRQLDYIFGNNPLSICYITGCSDKSPRHPHHRPSVAAGRAMPGMLVGGPNQHLEDACARKSLVSASPGCCYIDDVESYSTNETAIYWNSPLIYVMARLMPVITTFL